MKGKGEAESLKGGWERKSQGAHHSFFHFKTLIWDFLGSPAVETLPSNAEGAGSISHASQPENQNTKQKQYSNKFNKDFKSGPHLKKGGGRGGKSLLESATS